MNGWGWGGMTLMVLIAIAILALAVWAITSRSGAARADAPTARQQLDARLASGAIDVEEYGQRLEALTRS